LIAAESNKNKYIPEEKQKMKKRLLSLALSLFMLLGQLPTVSFADDENTGSCGDGLTWTVTGETLTIGGNGYMTDYSAEDPAPWSLPEFSDIKSVNIQSGVKSIGAFAFSDCTIESISLPDGLESIGDYAFRACGIKQISIPDSVSNIGIGAFCACIWLESAVLPSGLKNIAGYLFDECEELKNIDIPTGVENIGERAFKACRALGEVLSIPEGVKTIGTEAFSGCSGITELVIPSSIESIGGSAFKCKSLIKITFDGTPAKWAEISESCGIPENASITYLQHEHSFSGAWSGDEQYHWHACSGCDAISDKALHVYNGTDSCRVCGAKNPDYEHKQPTDAAFDDVEKGAYYYDAVQWALEHGITNGTGKTTFSPKNNCSRYQIVMFLWRAAGCPTASATLEFSDVKQSDIFYDAVQWAVENGITNGTSKTEFSPYADCTRGQIVTFLYRAAGSPDVSGDCGFADVSSGDFFFSAVIWALGHGITNGTSANRFSPRKTCTRAEAVTFLYRASV
jgi:hypothetical protein